MAHNLEQKNGVTSFAFNGKRGMPWHGLGQQADGAMFVKDALRLSQADYKVELQPVVAMTPELIHAMENGQMIDASTLLDTLIPNTRVTMRMDTEKSLGIVSDKYGIVQNEDAFKFVDMFCSGKFADRDNTPTIETCGVLGRGERVFVTAKFPEPVVIDAGRNDIVEMYVLFTTSHDGTGSVRCLVTPVRVVCNNTLNMAFENNIGRICFRHSSNVMGRLDLLNEENAEFAYKALNVAEVYEKALKESFDHLRSIKVSEKDLDKVLAEIALADEAKKAFLETGNIFNENIPTRGRNIFLGMKECAESGVGQDVLESGTALWAINGITSYYQNEANFKNEEVKMDNLLDGQVYKKVNKAYEMLVA